MNNWCVITISKDIWGEHQRAPHIDELNEKKSDGHVHCNQLSQATHESRLRDRD